MSNKYMVFPSPQDATATLAPDGFAPINGNPDVHSSGRAGLSFTVPDNVVDGHGANLVVSHPAHIPFDVRGRLFTKSSPDSQYAMLAVDDVRLTPTPTAPTPPEPTPPPVDEDDPLSIIQAVYDNGNYDLGTREGCGTFTEDAVLALFHTHAKAWGHVKKTGSQNQYNGHAVDAIMLLGMANGVPAGIYDIIYSSMGDDAKVVFNYADPVNPQLWLPADMTTWPEERDE